MIKIDGNNIIADENNVAGIKLPSWLKTGQTLEKGQYVFSISVIEFTINGTTLDYSQNISVTTIQTVPASKVWKIESIHKDPAMAIPVANTFTSSGTFTPTCTGTYRVQVWAGGGGGGAGNSCDGYYGGGGGAGGYAEGNFFLTGGTAYTVTVGAAGATGGGNSSNVSGGAGGTSSVGTIGISATGGAGGSYSNWCGGGPSGAGGAGGVGSGGQVNLTGGQGATGGAGGSAPNSGGGGGACSVAGAVPGGGGGGGCYNGTAGAGGTIIISNSGTGSGSGGSGSRDKLQAANVINAAITTSCGYTVPSGRVFRLDGVSSGSIATLYMGTSCGSSNRGAIYVNNATYSGGSSTVSQGWPYPQWFVGGTIFYYSSGTAYINGMEFTID